MKNREIVRRFLALVLLLAMVIGLIPQTIVPETKAAELTRAQVESSLTNLPALKPANRQIDLPRAYTNDPFEKVDAMNKAFKAISGSFYIVTESAASDGYYYIVHPWLSGGKSSHPGVFPAAKVEVRSNSVFGADPSLAATFEWCGEGVSGSIFPAEGQTRRSGVTAFHISFKDGRNLKFYNNGTGIRRNDSKNTTVNAFLNYLSGAFMFHYNNNEAYYMTLNTATKNFPYFELKDRAGSADPYFRLYQVLDNRVNTEPLYNAIIEMKSYLSREAEFEESSYQAFLECMYEAVQSYRIYNGVDQPEGTNVTELSKELKLLAEELQSYAMELQDYIDIAMEAYDFRADGFMFESLYTFGAPYSLSKTSPAVPSEDGTTTVPRPGIFTEGDNYDYSDEDCYQYSINGLIEDKLVNGRIVYTEAVVEYIALSILCREDFVVPSSYYEKWNGVFLERAEKIVQDKNLGSYTDTLKKTDTKAKGGTLLWNQVETAYDLAYYMLHGIWFKAEERPENVLENQTTLTGETIPVYYNTYIEEFTKLRLLPTGNNSYKFTTGKGFAYNEAGGYIYNDNNTRRTSAPTFNIAANLGYDSDDMFGLAQTGYIRKESGSTDVDTDEFYANANYYYAFHASSPFIYREEDNLFFSFVGDDDVYFFINGKLVCDLGGVHGAPSDSVNINEEIREGRLNLKEGDICSFDMFFVDRHLTSINMTLETNIKMMDATVDTEKFQYNAVTNEALQDGAAVSTGTNIGYGFAMTNRMELGITDLSFSDPNLGVSLDKNNINLNGTCQPSSLVVTYTTCDKYTGELWQGAAQEWTYTEFWEKLYKATFDPDTTVNPLAVGAYKIKLTAGEELTQLKNLLEIGLPANTRLEIKGMTKVAVGGRFTNTLTTGCYPLDLNDNPGTLISGTASCSLSAMSLNDVVVKSKASIVMDYGKPLNFNPSHLIKYIEYNRDTIELEFAGLRLNDRHGATYPTLPSDVSCTPQRPQALSNQGSFSRRSQYIRFTLNGMMEQIELCYLLYSVKYRDGQDIISWYVTLELALIPGTMMYYEAEQLAPDRIRYEEQYEISGQRNPEWLVKSDSDVSSGAAGTKLSAWESTSKEAQDTVISGEGQTHHLSEEFLFFSFDEGADYSSPVYKGLDYSQIANWAYNGNRNTNLRIEDGAFRADFSLSQDFINNKDYGYWFQTTSKYNNLSYHPTEQDSFKICIRLDQVRSTVTTEEFRIGVQFYCDGSSTGYCVEKKTFKLADYVDKGYLTIEFDLNSNNYQRMVAQGKTVTAIRLEINHLDDRSSTEAGSFAVDYMYIGPKDYSYLLEPECVFMDFTDSRAEQMHFYMNKGYGGTDWNEAKTWSHNTTNSGSRVVDTQNGVLSFRQTAAGYDNRNAESPSTMWIQGSVDALKNFPMSYDPSQAEVVQIRFKMKDMVPRYSMADVEKLTTQSERQAKLPKVYLQYYYTKNKWGDGSTNDNTEKIQTVEVESFFYDIATMDDQYMTVTMYARNAFKNVDKVTALRVSVTNVHSKSREELGTISIDYIYIGDVEHLPGHVTYGYDSSYKDDSSLSDGSSLFAQGKGVKVPNQTVNKNFTEINFDFKGTGFDIISRTGAQQGTIRVEVKNKTTGTVVKTLTVNNKGVLELCQIPVVSIRGLAYGSYTVTLWVNNAIQNGLVEALNRGNDFYFDALRIYEPLDVSANAEAKNAYHTDLESYPYIKEIRNILISSQTFGDLTDATAGALFVDTKEKADLVIPDPTPSVPPTEPVYTPGTEINLNNHYTLSVETYNKIGPKNEVYLDPGQAIAFKLEIPKGAVPASLDIGAKTLTGQKAQLAASILNPTDKASGILVTGHKIVRDIVSATAMYYPLETEGNRMYIDGSKRYCYVVIYNNPTASAPVGSRSHVLSITDIKATYRTDPGALPEDSVTEPEVSPMKSAGEQSEPLRFLVDQGTLSAARALILSMAETPLEQVEQGLSHSLNLSSDISLNYVVPKSALEGYDSFYLSCELPRYDGDLLADRYAVTLSPVEKGAYYYFTLEGLTAINMTDSICARLYMEKEGRTFVSQEDSYSIATYAYAQLGKNNASASLKALCAELLRYGAKAQIYKGYRTDALADASLTAEQATLLSNLDAVTFGNSNKDLNDLSSPTIKWVGKSLDLNSKVTLKYVFDLSGYKGNVSDLNLRLSFTDIYGNAAQHTITGAKAYNASQGWYVFDVDSLLAAELRSVVSAAIYEGDTQVSTTMVYSADTYANGKSGNLLTLCKALFAYSDSAKAFFTE